MYALQKVLHALNSPFVILVLELKKSQPIKDEFVSSAEQIWRNLALYQVQFDILTQFDWLFT